MRDERELEIIERKDKDEEQKSSNIYKISERARIVFIEEDE